MTSFIKKHLFWVIGVAILLLYLFTRLYNLTVLPVFTDEAIYIRWAQIASNDANWRFISLTDGKQSSYVWVGMILVKLFNDPLFAGRMVSVLAGLGSLIGIFFLASETFKNKRLGLFASFVYVIFPFSLLYDRLALYDSLVAMFMIWSLYFEILLIRNPRLDTAMILGAIMGGGMLTKTSANFALYLLPFSLLLFDFRAKKNKERLIRWAIYALIAAFIANALYLILRLSPYFHIIGQKNTTFVYTFSEWIVNPFSYVSNNLRGLAGWLLSYMTAPFLVLSAASFIAGKKFQKEKLLFFVWFFAPFSALAFFGKVIYPRFILFMVMPLLILGTYTLYHAISATKKLWLKAMILIVFLSLFVINDFFIITDFAKARLPQSDKAQFLLGWPSGVGVRETVAFLNEESKDKKIFVGTAGTFGLMPYSLEMYFIENKNVQIKGYWPINDMPPDEVLQVAKKMPTYFVFYQPCPSCPQKGLAPVSWPLQKIFQVNKLEKDTYYTLYKVVNK